MTFTYGQRVKVIAEHGDPSPLRQELIGQLGTVVRLRRNDEAAWVQMDKALPDELASFPAVDRRRNHLLMYPDECETA